ncbi:MAG: hypothetical protein M1325_04810 [Actinobacteria bacterium]|nr:hypothetical protein [Actinomycetota bacterium]
MTLRNKVMLELLVVAAATVVTTIVLRSLDIGAVATSVVALWALLYMLVFGYLVG